MHRRTNFLLFGILLALSVAMLVTIDINWPQSALPIAVIVLSIFGIYIQHKDPDD